MAPQLFQPIQIGNLRLDNRIIIAPMCQYSAVEGGATESEKVRRIMASARVVEAA